MGYFKDLDLTLKDLLTSKKQLEIVVEWIKQEIYRSFQAGMAEGQKGRRYGAPQRYQH